VAIQNSEGFEHRKRHEKFVYKSLVSSGNEGDNDIKEVYLYHLNV